MNPLIRNIIYGRAAAILDLSSVSISRPSPKSSHSPVCVLYYLVTQVDDVHCLYLHFHLIILENKSKEPIVNVYFEITSFICSHCGPFTIRKDRPLLHKYVAKALQRNWLQCIISQMQTLLAVGDRLPE